MSHIHRMGRMGAMLVVAGSAGTAWSQTARWEDQGNSAFFATTDASHNAQLWCDPMSQVFCALNDARTNLLPGFLGHGFGAACLSACEIDNCKNDGRSYARIWVDGAQQQSATINWRLDAKTFNSCECNDVTRGSHQLITADTTLDSTIELIVRTIPAGQTVYVNIDWWAVILVDHEPEAGIDDDASLAGAALEINGVNYLPPAFRNISDVRALGYFGPPGGGAMQFLARDGDAFRVRLAGDAAAELRRPGVRDNGAYSDNAESSFIGELTLSIDVPTPNSQNPATLANWFSDFSLDIGSDSEMSDPTIDGNERFDPGDCYDRNTALPVGGAAGAVDDLLIFAVDYWPQAPDGPPATTGAETCAGYAAADIMAVIDDRFDLDGADALDFSIHALVPPHAPSPLIMQFPSSCVHRPDYLTISYDDDTAGHYAGPGCSVPTNSPSSMGGTYGTSLDRDELLGVSLDETWNQFAGTSPMSVQSVYPVASEEEVHAQLAPNPDAREGQDDDVDALVIGALGCDYRYFSSDHEAIGFLPGWGPLDPGAIYEMVNNPPGAGPWKVIDPVIHLGLPRGVDIDAFDFTWFPHCDGCPPVLTLVFSVDDDDYLTVDDESGGLDPRKLYASTLGGMSFELAATPLADNIDAISSAPRPWMPAGCTIPPHVSLFNEDFESYPPLTPIGGQGGWETQGFDPTRDALVDLQQAQSGLHSLFVTTGSSVFHALPGGAATTYSFTARTYIPSQMTGTALLTLHDVYNPGGATSHQAVTIRLNGTNRSVREAAGGTPRAMIVDEWVPVRVEVNMVSDDVRIYYGGALLIQRSWTQNGATLPQLRAVGLQGSSGMWYDDITFKTITDCDGNGVDDGCDSLGNDCNINGTPDICDIAAGTSADANGNGVPDECEPVGPGCIGDLNGDLVVDLADLARLLSNYGTQFGGTPSLGDLDGDGDIDLADLAIMLSRFGTIC